MTASLEVYIDGELRLETAREGGVPGQLRALFARLETDMNAGIELDGVRIETPDPRQRCTFVLERLLHALEAGQTDFARALLIYLASHWPELRAVHVRRGGGGWDVRLDLA